MSMGGACSGITTTLSSEPNPTIFLIVMPQATLVARLHQFVNESRGGCERDAERRGEALVAWQPNRLEQTARSLVEMDERVVGSRHHPDSTRAGREVVRGGSEADRLDQLVSLRA